MQATSEIFLCIQVLMWAALSSTSFSRSIRLCFYIEDKKNPRLLSLRSKRFRWFRSKEQGTWVKDHRKNVASKRVRRGWGKKEGNACRQTLGFLKPHTWPVMPECTHPHLMLSSAVINWPIKCLAFHRVEVNFRGHVWNQNKVSQLVKIFW